MSLPRKPVPQKAHELRKRIRPLIDVKMAEKRTRLLIDRITKQFEPALRGLADK